MPSGQIGNILDGIYFKLRQETMKAIAGRALLVWEVAFQLLQSLLYLVSCDACLHGHVTLAISMNRVWRECWNANSNVLRSLWRWATVLDPAPLNSRSRLLGLGYLDPVKLQLEWASPLVAKMEPHRIDFARVEFLVWESSTVKRGDEFV